MDRQDWHTRLRRDGVRRARCLPGSAYVLTSRGPCGPSAAAPADSAGKPCSATSRCTQYPASRDPGSSSTGDSPEAASMVGHGPPNRLPQQCSRVAVVSSPRHSGCPAGLQESSIALLPGPESVRAFESVVNVALSVAVTSLVGRLPGDSRYRHAFAAADIPREREAGMSSREAHGRGHRCACRRGSACPDALSGIRSRPCSWLGPPGGGG